MATNGWETKPLSEVTEVIGGGTPRTSNPAYWNGDIVWLSPTDLPPIGNIVHVSDSKYKITQLGLEQSSARLLPKNSIVFSSRASIGKIGIADVDLCTNQGFTNFICGDRLINTYLAYALRKYTPEISVLSNSTTFAEVSKSSLKAFSIPVPPLPEQHRIVTKLDNLFTHIDKAIALVEQNITNTQHLMASVLNDVFISIEQAGHEKFTLQELLDKNYILSHLDGNHGSNYPRKEEFVSSGVPYISANCLLDGLVDFSKAKYLTETRSSQFTKGLAKNNDVLFAHNATVGPVALLMTNYSKVILSTSLTYYRGNPNFVFYKYLYFYLKSEPFINQYKAVMGQATRNQVPITKQREFFHFVPPVSLQQSIAKYLEKMESHCHQLTAKGLGRLTELKALKSSLLDSAFKGEL